MLQLPYAKLYTFLIIMLQLLDELHRLLPLDELVKSLIQTDIRGKIMTREDDFETLFKNSSKAFSEYDDQTEEMIKLLHKTRDEQVHIYYIKLGVNSY